MCFVYLDITYYNSSSAVLHSAISRTLDILQFEFCCSTYFYILQFLVDTVAVVTVIACALLFFKIPEIQQLGNGGHTMGHTARANGEVFW